jgi:hypothetical protein
MDGFGIRGDTRIRSLGLHKLPYTGTAGLLKNDGHFLINHGITDFRIVRSGGLLKFDHASGPIGNAPTDLPKAKWDQGL